MPVAQPVEQTNEMLQRAFDQGREYAAQQLAAQQAEQDTLNRREHMDALSRANEEQAKDLQQRIEALHRREYRYATFTARHPWRLSCARV